MRKTIFYTGLLIFMLGFSAHTIVFAQSYPAQKVLRYNENSEITALDPAFANTRAHIQTMNMIYEGLFRYDLSGGDIYPVLAKEWEISEDGLVYEFTIRQGIKFHNDPCFEQGIGREVKASDFVYSLKRILGFGTGGWLLLDKLLTDDQGNISDTALIVLDDYRFRVNLEKRFPAFLQMFALTYCTVVPREAVERYGRDFRFNPVGTGPFQLQAWMKKERIIWYSR